MECVWSLWGSRCAAMDIMWCWLAMAMIRMMVFGFFLSLSFILQLIYLSIQTYSNGLVMPHVCIDNYKTLYYNDIKY